MGFADLQTTQTNLLWAVCDSQNQKAWGDFYRIYAPMLRNFSRRLNLNETESEDVTQEILLIAHRSLKDGIYDPAKGRFRGWLYGIARKRAQMARRARCRPTRMQAEQYDDGSDLLSSLEDMHDEAIREIWEQEWRYALLEEALRQLKPSLGDNEFRSFELYAIQNWSVKKVADELNIAPASVYAYKNRVLNAIRKWIAQYEDDGPEISL